MRRRIVGYCICGKGEADRYLEQTAIKSFQNLCDDAIFLLNNASDKEKEMVEKYGYKWVEDDREWGKNQHRIKESFIRNHVAKLNPDITICLDADEQLIATREEIEAQFEQGYAFHVYIVNLWNKGWRQEWSFWNVRMWSWALKDELGESFWKYENRPLHCGLAPKWTYALNLSAPFILEHHGLKKKVDRQKKIERYEKYDPNQVYRASSYYEALAEDKDEVYDREKIAKQIKDDVSKVKQPLGKMPPLPKAEEKKYMVVNDRNGTSFDITEKEINFYKNQKHHRIVDL